MEIYVDNSESRVLDRSPDVQVCDEQVGSFYAHENINSVKEDSSKRNNSTKKNSRVSVTKLEDTVHIGDRLILNERLFSMANKISPNQQLRLTENELDSRGDFHQIGDRSRLSLEAPKLKQEMGLSNIQGLRYPGFAGWNYPQQRPMFEHRESVIVGGDHKRGESIRSMEDNVHLREKMPLLEHFMHEGLKFNSNPVFPYSTLNMNIRPNGRRESPPELIMAERCKQTSARGTQSHGFPTEPSETKLVKDQITNSGSFGIYGGLRPPLITVSPGQCSDILPPRSRHGSIPDVIVSKYHAEMNRKSDSDAGFEVENKPGHSDGRHPDSLVKEQMQTKAPPNFLTSSMIRIPSSQSQISYPQMQQNNLRFSTPSDMQMFRHQGFPFGMDPRFYESHRNFPASNSRIEQISQEITPAQRFALGSSGSEGQNSSQHLQLPPRPVGFGKISYFPERNFD